MRGAIQVMQIDRVAAVSGNRVICGQRANPPHCPTCIIAGSP
jgi:hypothetical protein